MRKRLALLPVLWFKNGLNKMGLNMGNNYELRYYKEICDIQRQHISGEISKEEMDSRCEIERQKYISYLHQKNLELQQDIENQMRVTALMESIGKK